jgi:hypothetical protein
VTALLKLALVPLGVWLVSLAGRRWGHGVAGWISGLPVIAGPITLFVTLAEGPAFGADASLAILQATPANAVHYLVYAYVSRRFGWAAALIAGWSAFLVAAFALVTLAPPLAIAALLNVVILWGIVRLLPRVAPVHGPTPIPDVELAVRMLAAFALAAALVYGAPILGPRLSGILLTFPISGSVLPVFTRALHGWPATVRLLDGFVRGLGGFAAFFAALAAVLATWGTTAGFLAAVGFALLVTWTVRQVGRMRA